ncbi:MAG: alpha/beta fold hydrolase, partial [Anaerolineae bacterium]|nr:alpha/beta fold hydrolase [Anaerolineae bacterium]
WLSTIAEKQYGDPLAYAAIIEATNAKAAEDESFTVIDDPGVIEVGQKLWLPTEAGTSEAVATTPLPPANFGEAWEAVDCTAFNLSDEIAAISDCGYVTVPEFHSQPDGPTIQVAVVRTRSTGDNPAHDPLFMEQGGPGDSTIAIFPGLILPLAPNLQAILASRDIVFVEERGTFYSRPSLVCPEEVEHDIQVAKGLEEDEDRDWLAACRDRLAAEGVNFNAFNSIENAADMYFVAETLGYDSFNFYGVSYGTLLGQYVIDQADEHTAELRSVTIDAVVTSDIDFTAQAGSTASYALRNLFAECAQDEACNQHFPDLETVFFSLVDQLNQEPVSATLTVTDEAGETLETIDTTLSGQDLIIAVFGRLYSDTQNRALPQIIYQTAQTNEFDWVAEAISPGYGANPKAEAMYLAILCARSNSIQRDGKTFFDTPYESLEFLSEEGAKTLRLGCEVIQVDPEESFALDNTDIPTLIMNGTRDPITPQPYGEYIGSQLETAYVYTIPGSGHGSMLRESCPGQITLDFLTDPTQAPDSSCIDDMQPIFVYEEAETASTPPANVGEAWEAVSCDTFNLPGETAAQADCGYVTVPEFHSQPDGPTIQIAVVRVPSNGDNPAPDPMFMEQGGPGGSTIQAFAISNFTVPIIQSILGTRDLVFVEQRGTFYSRPSLVCTEEVDHDIQVASELIEDLDRTFAATCLDRLLDEGVNFDAFNSVENAADIYFVAETLGYDSFNYYGVSYGTLLGQYVIEQAEEHNAQLRSVMLDGVVTSNMEFNAPAGSAVSYALRNLFAECAQDAVCHERFPDLETVFLSLVEKLNQEPVPITFTVIDQNGEPLDTIDANLDGNELATAVMLSLYDTGANRLLPYNIYQSAQNDAFGWVAAVLSPGYSPAPEAHGMYVSVLCARTSSDTVDGTTFFDPPYAELTFLGEEAAETLRLECELIEVAGEEPFVLDNLDTPTLIVNGTRDPVTPRPYGEFVGSQLSTAYVITIPGTGHGSIYYHFCSIDIVLEFLANPTQTPDLSCVSEIQPQFEYGDEEE